VEELLHDFPSQEKARLAQLERAANIQITVSNAGGVSASLWAVCVDGAWDDMISAVPADMTSGIVLHFLSATITILFR